MRVEEIRELFPGLGQTVYGRPLVYFDNAATAMRPVSVLEKWRELSSFHNSNIHRAVHKLAADATQEYEKTRDFVKEYINAGGREEVIFTSGTTAAINLVAFCFGEAFVNQGDEIIVSEEEHHSNIVPWQMMCSRKGAVLKVLPVTDDGHLDISALGGLLTPRTKLLAVTQISNTLGIKNPIKEIVNICHSNNCYVLADGAQGIVHEGMDVRADDVDFYVFSGHKIYGRPERGCCTARRNFSTGCLPIWAEAR